MDFNVSDFLKSNKERSPEKYSKTERKDFNETRVHVKFVLTNCENYVLYYFEREHDGRKQYVKTLVDAVSPDEKTRNNVPSWPRDERHGFVAHVALLDEHGNQQYDDEDTNSSKRYSKTCFLRLVEKKRTAWTFDDHMEYSAQLCTLLTKSEKEVDPQFSKLFYVDDSSNQTGDLRYPLERYIKPWAIQNKLIELMSWNKLEKNYFGEYKWFQWATFYEECVHFFFMSGSSKQAGQLGVRKTYDWKTDEHSNYRKDMKRIAKRDGEKRNESNPGVHNGSCEDGKHKRKRDESDDEDGDDGKSDSHSGGSHGNTKKGKKSNNANKTSNTSTTGVSGNQEHDKTTSSNGTASHSSVSMSSSTSSPSLLKLTYTPKNHIGSTCSKVSSSTNNTEKKTTLRRSTRSAKPKARTSYRNAMLKKRCEFIDDEAEEDDNPIEDSPCSSDVEEVANNDDDEFINDQDDEAVDNDDVEFSNDEDDDEDTLQVNNTKRHMGGFIADDESVEEMTADDIAKGKLYTFEEKESVSSTSTCERTFVIKFDVHRKDPNFLKVWKRYNRCLDSGQKASIHIRMD